MDTLRGSNGPEEAEANSAKPQRRLIVQNNVQQRAVDLDPAVVVNES